MTEEIKQIEIIRAQKQTLENLFNNEIEPKMIESYIYQMQAIDAKYSYLLGKIRQVQKVAEYTL